MRKFKKGDLVIYNNKEEKQYGRNNKIATIVFINPDDPLPYLLEFKEKIVGHNGSGKGKNDHCYWCNSSHIKLAIDYLKFKKWIKG